MSLTRRILITLAIAAVPAVAILVLTYDIVGVDFVGFMEDQPSIDYQEPPRVLPPEEAVPLSRSAYLDEANTAVNPVPADAISLQRGGVLFDLHCAVCHGAKGEGNGTVVRFWQEDARRPANLTETRLKQYPDGALYTLISNGVGTMPPLRENLTERQRWDVINYLRTLQP
jgi:mono/diheme cytochrome c family protein